MIPRLSLSSSSSSSSTSTLYGLHRRNSIRFASVSSCSSDSRASSPDVFRCSPTMHDECDAEQPDEEEEFSQQSYILQTQPTSAFRQSTLGLFRTPDRQGWYTPSPPPPDCRLESPSPYDTDVVTPAAMQISTLPPYKPVFAASMQRSPSAMSVSSIEDEEEAEGDNNDASNYSDDAEEGSKYVEVVVDRSSPPATPPITPPLPSPKKVEPRIVKKSSPPSSLPPPPRKAAATAARRLPPPSRRKASPDQDVRKPVVDTSKARERE